MIDIHDNVIDRLALRIAHHHVRLAGVRAMPFTAVPAGQLVLVSQDCALLGWVATGAAACAFTINDGPDPGAVPLAGAAVAANTPASQYYGTGGVLASNGLVLNVTTGPASGSVFYRLARDLV